MSEAFERYERQYCELYENLSKDFASATLLDGEQREQKLSEVKAGLDSAESLIKKMDLEARSFQPNVKAVLLAKLREYELDLTTLKSETTTQTASPESTQAARDEILEAGMNDTGAASVDQKERPIMSTERQDECSDNRIRESREIMLETEGLSVPILHDMDSQHQPLLQDHKTLQGVDDNITSSSKRMSRNAWTISAIVAALIVGIVLIMYFNFS